MSATTCEKPEAVLAAEPRPTAQELWKRYHRRADSKTENSLIEQYLPLVRSALGRLAMTLPDHVDHDDLYSAGLIGLLQAYIFTILASVYIGAAIRVGEGD